MWRALFLAMGMFLIILGVQCLGVAQFTLKIREEPSPSTSLLDSTPKLGAKNNYTSTLGPLESYVHWCRGMPVFIYTSPTRIGKLMLRHDLKK